MRVIDPAVREKCIDPLPSGSILSPPMNDRNDVLRPICACGGPDGPIRSSQLRDFQLAYLDVGPGIMHLECEVTLGVCCPRVAPVEQRLALDPDPDALANCLDFEGEPGIRGSR